MSLQALRLDALKIKKSLPAVAAFIEALESSTQLEQLANAAVADKDEAEKKVEAAGHTLKMLVEESEKAKKLAADYIKDAQADAAKIRADAKKRGEVAVQKAQEKVDAIDKQHNEMAAKYELDKQMKDEVLAMLGAQIAHAEAKLNEIREAIAKLAKV